MMPINTTLIPTVPVKLPTRAVLFCNCAVLCFQGDEFEDEQDVMPTSTTLVPTVPVDVGVWSIGSFRLKGVAELIRVVQVLPISLKYRMEHLPRGALNKV